MTTEKMLALKIYLDTHILSEGLRREVNYHLNDVEHEDEDYNVADAFEDAVAIMDGEPIEVRKIYIDIGVYPAPVPRPVKVYDGNFYDRPGRIEKEKNDCSVIAFSYAFNIDYAKAHNLLAVAGRKFGQGFRVEKAFKLDYKPLATGPGTKARTFMKRWISYHGKPGQTVGTFQKKHPKGIYMVNIAGHIFTIINGVIFNQFNMNSRVESYIKVQDLSISKSKNK